MSKNKIIFIGASARSGSSIFETHLAKKLDCLVVGELRWFWKRGVIDDERCSCGEWFHDCKFWTNHSMSSNKDFALEMEQNKLYFDRFLNVLPFYIPFLKHKNWQEKWDKYSNGLSALYTESSQNKHIIIDSSKRPFYFIILLNALKEFDISFINFVRESRGVSFSWAKKKIRVESRNKEPMTQYGLIKSSIFWNAYTIINTLISIFYKNSFLICYEDFCREPIKVIEDLHQKLSLSSNKKMGSVLNHSVSGNPSRFDASDKIFLDQEWRQKSLIWKVTVYLLTIPGRLFIWLQR